MFWGYVRHIRVTCESEQTQTRTRKQKILEKGETIRFGETFSREQWPVCVQCWRKWWIQPGRSISINSTFERLNGMHIYINGDNWLLWILSTIRSKTKIISARRVAYCSTAFPRNETLQLGSAWWADMSWPLRQHTISPSLPGLCEFKILETKWEQEPLAAVSVH